MKPNPHIQVLRWQTTPEPGWVHWSWSCGDCGYTHRERGPFLDHRCRVWQRRSEMYAAVLRFSGPELQQ